MSTNKHGNGEGSIRKRADGLWEARLHLPNGKRKSLYGETRQEVARKLAEARRDRDRGIPIVGEKQTVAQYVANWLEMVKPTIRPRTWTRYRELLTLHVVPTLGKVPLSKLTAQHVLTLYRAKLDAGFSPTTVHHLGTVLHGAWRRPSGLRRSRLAVTTGMRQGELLALRRGDVDLNRSTLSVRATLQHTKAEGYHLAAPKTKHSQRQIALGELAVAALRRHCIRQDIERLRSLVWEVTIWCFPIQWASRWMG